MFPAWRYHKDHEPVIVPSLEAFERMGPGWVDSPARVNEGGMSPQAWQDAPAVDPVQRRRRGPGKVKK
jgi:hypothetical protein